MTALYFLAGSLVLKADIIHVAPSDFMCDIPNEPDLYIRLSNNYLELWTGSYTGKAYYNFNQLPHNGTIDQLRICYFDESESASIEIKFYRRHIVSGSFLELASWTSSGAGTGIQSVDINTFSKPTIKSKAYTYFLQIEFKDSNPDFHGIGLVAVRLRYYGGNQ